MASLFKWDQNKSRLNLKRKAVNMSKRSILLAFAFLFSGQVAPAFTQTPPASTADLVFAKTNVPASLVPGDLVHVQFIISSKLKGNGELVQKTQDYFKDVEVVKVDRNPPPETPGVKVTFRVSEDQAKKMAGLMQKAPKVKDKQGIERMFMPLRIQLARERLTGIEGRAEEIVKEGAVKLERVSLTDPSDKKVRLKFGKEVVLDLDLYIGELLKEPIIPAEGRITNSKKAPVDVVYVLTFFDEMGNVVAASTASARGIYQGIPRTINGAMVKGRAEDFRSITKYRFYACIFPSVEPDGQKAEAKAGNVTKLKLVSPQEGAVLALVGSKFSSWTFKWEPVNEATLYQLLVQRNGSAEPLVNVQVRTSTFSRRDIPAFMENEFKGWTWKVRALVNDQWTDWSEERTFSVGPSKKGSKQSKGGSSIGS
jgi:hypothetical protein